MCSLRIISFEFNFSTSELNWFWTGSETVPIVLALTAIIFGTLWFFYYRKYQTTNK